MGSKIYVGGLPYSTAEQELADLFGQHGNVTSAKIITDKYTGQSRGFGFVEMGSDEEAKSAIDALNGTELGGRTLTVNEAKPQAPRTGFGGGASRGPGGKRPGGGGGNRGGRW
jgi:RNA recognition motif-containing protein